MLTIDLPEAPPTTQVVLIAQAPQATEPVGERVAGVCRPVDYRTPDGDDGSYWPDFNGGLDPQTVAHLYFSGPDVQRPPLEAVKILARAEAVILGTTTSPTSTTLART